MRKIPFVAMWRTDRDGEEGKCRVRFAECNARYLVAPVLPRRGCPKKNEACDLRDREFQFLNQISQ